MEETITLQANQSGQLWTDDPDAWAHLCSPEGCPICQEGPPQSDILAETPMVWICGQPEATLPGYICITSKQHVVEPYELSPFVIG